MAARLVLLWGAWLVPLAFWPPFEDAFKLPQTMVAAGAALGLAAASRAQNPLAVFRGPKVRERLPVAMTGAGAVAAAYSLVQAVGWDPVAPTPGGVARPFSSMGNPDFLAAYLAAVFPLAALRATRRPRPTAIGAAALIMAGLLVAQSRGAWLGLLSAAGLGAMLLRRSPGAVPPRRLAGLALASLAAGAAFVVIHPLARERAAAAFRPGHADASGRLYMWHVAAGMIRDRPLRGVGPGGFGGAYPERHAALAAAWPEMSWFFTENAHNDWLQLPAEAGLPAFGLEIWIWCAFVRSAWRRWRAGSLTALGWLLGFAAFQVNALVNFPWYLRPTQAWFLLAWGWLAAGPARGDAATASRQFRWVAAAACLAAGVWGGRELAANGWLKLSGDAVASGRWAPAADAAARSLARWGWWEGRVRAVRNAGTAAFGREAFAEAEAHARTAVALAPGLPASWSALGLALARAGNLAEAEAACGRALALNPGQADACHVLGNVAYLRRDPAAAASWWRRALQLDPSLEGARRSLAGLEAAGAGMAGP